MKKDLNELKKIELKRCIKPGGSCKTVHISSHFFTILYSSYLGLAGEYGHIHCTLMMAKASVAPMRFVSIPRLDLVVAVLAVKISV